ncbi:MAG: hypothetical protein ACRDK2_05575, partial [Solirubrobacteraceae bacterium]
LLEVLDRLVQAGNSVVVIEHNLDVIKVSDRLIDLGPEGGDEGGQLIATGRTLYILDEPTTGLHFADVARLLEVLARLVDAGNSVVVIEHNLDVIKCADRLIDMGPEGGEEGGEVIAAGTPEEVAAERASHTGHFLSTILNPAGTRANTRVRTSRSPRAKVAA